jgi:hypothetical protein
VWRVEVQPGEEVQIDFGTGAPVIDAEGRRRRPWVLRVILSFSRKAYSEAVFHQTTENLIRCLEVSGKGGALYAGCRTMVKSEHE